MDLGLNGKLALVTASSGGIGLAIARSLAAEGAKVAINGRNKQSVDKAVAKIRADVPDADLVPLVADNATAPTHRTASDRSDSPPSRRASADSS